MLYGRGRILRPENSASRTFRRGRFGADVSARTFRRGRFGADVSARAFRRGRFGAEVSARRFRRGRFGADVSARVSEKNARKIHAPLFGEFGRSSQDLRESDYDSPKSWDDRPNSPKNCMQSFQTSNDPKIAKIAPISTLFCVSERFRMHPNVSEQVRTDPNRSKHDRKL